MTEPIQSNQDAAALTAEEQAELAQFDYNPDEDDEDSEDYEEDEGGDEGEGDEETNAHDREVAVAPLLEIDPDDVKEGASAFDAWLRSISGDSLNVERLRMLAGSLPAVGNIMAVVDVFGDIVTLVENKTNDPLDWVNLGINLLGAIPAPGTAAARMTLRPMVMMIKQEFKHQLQQSLKVELSDGVITRLAGHLNDSTEGQLGKFAQDMRATLPEMLRQAANWGEELVIYIGHALQDAAKAKLNAQGEIENAHKEWDQAVDPLLNDPDKQITHMLSAFWSLCKATVKHIVNTISEYMLPPAVRAKVLGVAQAVLDMAPAVREQIKNLGDESKTLSIGWLLMKFSQAATGQGGIAVAGNLRQGTRGRVRYKHKGPTHGSLSRQRKAKKNAKRCKTGTGTCGSISFALGTETITHTDFTLPGPFALEWARTYCSNLAGYDQGILGARWISDYTTRLDLRSEGPDREGVRYYGADGRSHDYPLPNVGGLHYDPIEGIMLVRTGPQTLTLAAGHERREIYQQHRRHFRLTAIELRSGARLALHYEHHLGARSVLSDLISYQGDTLHTHIGTQLYETGRIIGLWQIADGQRKRQLAQYRYDESGDLIQAHDEHVGQWDYRYQHHLLNRYTDRTGRGMNLLWKGTSRHAKAVREWADDGSFDVSLKWDKNIRLTTLTDAHGNQTKYYYDILGYPYRIVHPDGLSEWLDRDAARNVTQHLHTDASVHYFAYDERSNLLEHERPDNSTVHYAYNGQDQLIKIRDPEGGLWTRDYDQRGNLIEATDPLGNKTQYRYDSAGQLAGITDAKGGQSALAYDANGQLIQYTDCSGQSSSWKYDALGQQIESCDAQGNVTRYAYHAGHLVTVIHPDGAEEHFERDAEGRLLTHTDALKRRTRWSYTVAGMIAQRTDAMGHSVDYQWDKLGQLTGLVNENERSMRFAYDAAGRLLEETGVDGKTTSYHYHSRNGILAEIRHGRLQSAFAFDPLGRVTERRARKLSAPGNIASAPGPWQVKTYAYDGNGRLALAGNSGSRLQWFYDAAGNLVREHQHYLASQTDQVAVWRHEYDALNQRIATIRPDGQREDRLTYGSGHVHGILLNQRELVNVERDSLHREVRRQQGNRLVQTQAWDPLGRVSEQSLMREPQAQGPAAPAPVALTSRVLHRRYRYDEVGQLTHIQDSRRGAISYRYDPVGRLLESASVLGQEIFAFDPAGNLLDVSQSKAEPVLESYEGNPVHTYRHQPRSALLDNLLRKYAGTSYYYDDQGNLTDKYQNGEPHSRYEWDNFNRLIAYEDGRLQVRYDYDALGRRQIKHSQARYRPRPGAGAQWNQAEQAKQNHQYDCGLTLYGWDGDALAWESRQERTTHYFYEPQGFVPLAQAVSRGAMRLHTLSVSGGVAEADQDVLWTTEQEPPELEVLAWYQCDYLGTPQELTGEQGEIAWSAQYRAWGVAQEVISTAARSAGLRNPLRFQGQYFDHETGLHYNRHRYYDPQVGRFLSQDPIGLAGGLNAFVYVPSPTGGIDPLGLCSTKLNTALKGERYDHMQAHHLIPQEIWKEKKVFFEKIGMGGEMDAAENGLLMPDSETKAKSMSRRFYHCGSHGKYYSRMVERKIKWIENKYADNPAEARNQVENYQKRLRTVLSAPGQRPQRVR